MMSLCQDESVSESVSSEDESFLDSILECLCRTESEGGRSVLIAVASSSSDEDSSSCSSRGSVLILPFATPALLVLRSTDSIDLTDIFLLMAGR